MRTTLLVTDDFPPRLGGVAAYYAELCQRLPARQIAVNAGREGSVVVEEIRKQGFKVGYDAQMHTYVDMFEAGIVDPKMVTRSALQNAASIASIMLTTEATVTDLPEEKKSAGGPPDMGGMGMM